MKAKQIFEFTRNSDPLKTLGIGYSAKIYKFFDDLGIDRDDYTIKDKDIIFYTTLNLDDCNSLVELPDNLIAIGLDLTLINCINLIKLPNNLKLVKSYLYLVNCKNLRQLPNDLKVGGSLNLFGCKNLKQLPNNLKVGGNLYLKGCSRLVKLPDNLKVQQYIIVKKNQVKLIKWIESSKFSVKLKVE